MTTTLYLSEKSSEAETLAKALGITNKTGDAFRAPGIIVTYASGHLFSLAEAESYGQQFEKWTLDSLPCLPETWLYVLDEKYKARYNSIKALLKEADTVVIATDPDREGELIARIILNQANYKKTIKRLWPGELTVLGYKKALEKIEDGSKRYSLYESGLGRSHADWGSGINVTRGMTAKFSVGGKDNTLHFGRVQTPTLAMIVQRERDIKNFKPSDYFTIAAEFGISGRSVKVSFVPKKEWLDKAGRISDAEVASTIVSECKKAGDQFKVSKYETTEERELAPLPYYITSLQKECSKLFGMRSDRVLEICQVLYRPYALISYPRGEGKHYPDEYFAESQARLDALKTLDPSIANLCDLANTTVKPRAFDSVKVVKEGSHFGIITTDKTDFDLKTLTSEEMQVYDLIRRRFIAQFLPPYILDKTVIEANHDQFTFSAIGRTPKSPGWKSIYPSALTEKSDDVQVTLPTTELDATAGLSTIAAEKKQTTPPARFTEETLINKMENIHHEIDDEHLSAVMRDKERQGIGTPATRGEAIKKLFDGGYVVEQKKFYYPTEKGVALINLLNKVCPELTDLSLTALWEDELSKVERGELELARFERAIKKFVTVCVEKIKAAEGYELIGTIAHPCPLCGKGMSRRKKKDGNGYWWGCTGYPACENLMDDKAGKPVARAKAVPVQPSTEHFCGLCNKPLIKRSGKKGFFWGCSGYPSCKQLYKDRLGKPVK